VITAGRGYDYLTKEVATSRHDYYTGSGEAPGQWAGRSAALLGLSGEVDADEMAVLYGRFVVPSTAGGTRLPSGRWEREQVLGRAVSTRVRADGSVLEPIAALDVTFSPSKSVSLLWALSSDPLVRESVVDAHEAAVSTALEYLDAHASHTRTGAGGVRRVESGGFVIAQFRHRTARSTVPGERVGDPQLHSHCAILNRVRGVDGVWRTLDSRAIQSPRPRRRRDLRSRARAVAVGATPSVVGTSAVADTDARDRRHPRRPARPILIAPCRRPLDVWAVGGGVATCSWSFADSR
jgi:conjugative relaxase-like TrwC/TraI family protein